MALKEHKSYEQSYTYIGHEADTDNTDLKAPFSFLSHYLPAEECHLGL